VSQSSGPRAGFWARLAAALVDAILLGIATSILGGLFGLGGAFEFEGGDEGFGFQAGAQGLSILAGLLYYGYFEGGPSGQTIGKRLLSIRVIRFDTGQPLGWGTAILRNLASYLSGLAFALGYLWMLWDREKQTWHDKLTTTVVVPTSVYPPPPGSFGRPPQ
jgi:uncharacterized RDD family membrane protein YckC